jgi:Plus-3 domain
VVPLTSRSSCHCIFEDLGVDIVKPYMIDDKTVNQTIDLKHGKSIRSFWMDKVSNSQFLPVGAQLSRLTSVF